MGVTLAGNPIHAVLFDWAGTTVDHGSLAPVRAFSEAFRTLGVPITDAEARGPMGRAKRDHIAQILTVPRVKEVWRRTHGREPAEADVDALYQRFLPLQKEVLSRHCDVIAGVPEVVAWLREFTEQHYVVEPKRRQRPQSFRGLQDRFGNPASVSTTKKFGGGGAGGAGHG